MFKSIVIAAVAALGLTSAVAAKSTPYPPPSYKVSSNYFHAHSIPAEYLGPSKEMVVVKKLPHREVWEYCGAPMEGCSARYEGRIAAYIFIDAELPAAEQAFVERHERAHLNGWKHN